MLSDGGLEAELGTACTGWVVELLPRLRRMAGARYGIPAQDCEDVVQSSVLDFLLQARKYENTAPGLLVVIARRRCTDYWRTRQVRTRRAVSLESLAESDPRLVQGNEYAEGLLDGIALASAWLKITPRCQELLSDRFFQFECSREIARAVGDTREAVKRYMSRCLERLRGFLEARA